MESGETRRVRLPAKARERRTSRASGLSTDNEVMTSEFEIRRRLEESLEKTTPGQTTESPKKAVEKVTLHRQLGRHWGHVWQ
jgi:hypothetical protein